MTNINKSQGSYVEILRTEEKRPPFSKKSYRRNRKFSNSNKKKEVDLVQDLSNLSLFPPLSSKSTESNSTLINSDPITSEKNTPMCDYSLIIQKSKSQNSSPDLELSESIKSTECSSPNSQTNSQSECNFNSPNSFYYPIQHSDGNYLYLKGYGNGSYFNNNGEEIKVKKAHSTQSQGVGFKYSTFSNKQRSQSYDEDRRQLISAEKFEIINKLALEFCSTAFTTAEELDKQSHMLDYLQTLTKQVFPNAILEPFGSTANGLSLANADMDLCGCFQVESDHTVTAHEFVETLGKTLQQDLNFLEVKVLTRTRIPIIKLKHTNGLNCDIGFENKLALQNTKLLKMYSLIDERFKQLVFLVKYWSKVRYINEPYFGTLSRYNFLLYLVIVLC